MAAAALPNQPAQERQETKEKKDDVVAEIGDRAGRLGVEIADMTGLIGDLSALGEEQATHVREVAAAARQMDGANRLLAAAMAETRASADNTRRTIILLTDGENTSGQMKIHEAIERAQKADALIYAVGIGDSYQGGVDEGALRKITEQTGGRAYFPHNERELRDAFSQIQRDLREQYLIAYSPTNKSRDGSYRRIQIEVVVPELRKQKLKLNYRPGYFAKTTDQEIPSRHRSSP